MTTVKALLAGARQRLIAADIDNAALDARLLLQNVTGLGHAEIVGDPDHEVTEGQASGFAGLVDRRQANEPVSRILGRREFYGREFVVTPDVLDPRADTEALLELCLDHLAADREWRILDLGTGSGILAISLAAELPLTHVEVVDVSVAALAVARSNAGRLGVAARCHLHRGNWFSGSKGTYDLIVSNPPYIETAAISGLEPDVRNFDPLLALDGGADGLSAYRSIAGECASYLTGAGKVAVEIGAGQQADVTAIFESHGLSCLEARKDLGGHVRGLIFGVALSN
jgi:release factor glutamine methyltransferase